MKKLKPIGGLVIILIFGCYPIPMQGATQPNLYPIEMVRDGKAAEVEEVIRILENYFQKIYPERSHRIEIRDIRGYEKFVLPSGLFSVEVIGPEQVYRGGNIAATLLFHLKGQEAKRIRITARVDIYTDVVVAGHSLKKHHEITEKDVQVANRNISLLPHGVVTEIKDVIGKRTTLSINTHEPLRTGMVEIPPLIRKGDRVILLAENHLFKITTLGETKEEGRKGERIKLINLSSKKEVYGRVINSNTVQIDF